MPQAFRILQLPAALVALGLMSAPAQAATYEFTVVGDLPAATTAYFEGRVYSVGDFAYSMSLSSGFDTGFGGYGISNGRCTFISVSCTPLVSVDVDDLHRVITAVTNLTGVGAVEGFFFLGFSDGSLGAGGFRTDLQLVATPLPGALPLFASVLGAGAWFARRRFTASKSP